MCPARTWRRNKQGLTVRMKFAKAIITALYSAIAIGGVVGLTALAALQNDTLLQSVRGPVVLSMFGAAGFVAVTGFASLIYARFLWLTVVGCFALTAVWAAIGFTLSASAPSDAIPVCIASGLFWAFMGLTGAFLAVWNYKPAALGEIEHPEREFA